MTDLSFVPGVALGLTLGIGGTWMAMKAANALLSAALRDCQSDRDYWIEEVCEQIARTITLRREKCEAIDAHSRCSDALNVCQSKLSDVRDLLSQPETIRKADLRRILGEAQ